MTESDQRSRVRGRLSEMAMRMEKLEDRMGDDARGMETQVRDRGTVVARSRH